MDAGAIIRTTTGLDVSVETVGARSEPLRRKLLPYLDELTPDEVQRALSGVALTDADVFTPERKATLRLYAEYLVPRRIHGFCCRGWVNRHSAYLIVVARAGPGARYSRMNLSGFDALGSVVAVGEALHVSDTHPTGGAERLVEEHARDRGLTRGEAQVVKLVAQGLSNTAIGLVLGRSKNTVRNQLAATFAKLRVCTRTDLVAALSTPVPTGTNYLAHRAGALATMLAAESGRSLQLRSPPTLQQPWSRRTRGRPSAGRASASGSARSCSPS